MEEQKHSGAQLKGSQKYTFTFIGIGMAFVCASALVLFAKGAGVTDLYAAFSGIIGGLIGGLITLEGVRRTVYAQIDIELSKSIPTKLLHLYKLKKEIKFFKDTQTKVDDWSWDIDYRPKPSNSDRSEATFDQLFEMLEGYRDLKKFAEQPLDDAEYKFVEIVSEIDLDLYYKVVHIFQGLNDRIKNLNQTLESVDFKIHFQDERLVKSALDLYKECITIEKVDGVKSLRGKRTFINYMNSSTVSPGQIVNTLRNAVPHFKDIDSYLDKAISELSVLMKEKEDELKGNKQKLLEF